MGEAPMTREDLRSYLKIRMHDDDDIDAAVEEHLGLTETEMDALVEACHGSMA